MFRIWRWLLELFGRGAPPSTLAEATARDARSMIAAGVGMSALAVVEIAAGSVCPICIVAAPVLLGVGAHRKWRARRMAKDTALPSGEDKITSLCRR